MRMRVVIAGLTALFVLLGGVALTGGVAGLFRSTDGVQPDTFARSNSLMIIAFSLVLLAGAAVFAKINWPDTTT